MKDEFNEKFLYLIFKFDKEFKKDDLIRLEEAYTGENFKLFYDKNLTLYIKKVYEIDPIVKLF